VIEKTGKVLGSAVVMLFAASTLAGATTEEEIKKEMNMTEAQVRSDSQKMAGWPVAAHSIIHTKETDILVQSMSPNGNGPFIRAYIRKDNKKVIGMAFARMTVFPNLNAMALYMAPFLPHQIDPHFKKSRFVFVVDWTDQTISGRMYFPQLIPDGFSPDKIR